MACSRCCCWPGWAGPATLLFFIFVAGCCTALMSPAWNSTVADTIPRDELPQAITADRRSPTTARARSGPALAGVVFALVGGAWNFAIAVLGTLVHAAGGPPLAAARRIRRRACRPSACGAAC